MSKKSLKNLTDEAINYTKEGLELLLEVSELQAAVKNTPKTENYYQLVKEIIEKEKLAVGLIERATLIQRDLINKQRESTIKLINSL